MLKLLSREPYKIPTDLNSLTWRYILRAKLCQSLKINDFLCLKKLTILKHKNIFITFNVKNETKSEFYRARQIDWKNFLLSIFCTIYHSVSYIMFTLMYIIISASKKLFWFKYEQEKVFELSPCWDFGLLHGADLVLLPCSIPSPKNPHHPPPPVSELSPPPPKMTGF